MERRQIIGAVSAAGCTVGAACAIASLQPQLAAYHIPLLATGIASICSGIVGFIRLFQTAPSALPFFERKREFLDTSISPADLRAKVEGRTSVQIDALNQTYSDKWMTITGAVGDVTNLAGSKWGVHIRDRSDDFTSVIFEKRWYDQLITLRRGDVVTVVGRIASLNYGLSLSDGELIHIGGPWPNQPEGKNELDSK